MHFPAKCSNDFCLSSLSSHNQHFLHCIPPAPKCHVTTTTTTTKQTPMDKFTLKTPTTKFLHLLHHHHNHYPNRRSATPYTRLSGPLPPSSDLNPLQILWHHQILDPDSDIVTYWNHVFLITSIIALFIDPLYFFLPYIDADNTCFSIDHHLAVLITYFRSIADLFFFLHVVMKFRTAFVAPSSRVVGRGELVMDSKEIARRYVRSDFIIDLAAALPLPQVNN